MPCRLRALMSSTRGSKPKKSSTSPLSATRNNSTRGVFNCLNVAAITLFLNSDPVTWLDCRIRDLARLDILQLKLSDDEESFAIVTSESCFFRFRRNASGGDERLRQSQTTSISLLTRQLHFAADVDKLRDVRMQRDHVAWPHEQVHLARFGELNVERLIRLVSQHRHVRGFGQRLRVSDNDVERNRFTSQNLRARVFHETTHEDHVTRVIANTNRHFRIAHQTPWLHLGFHPAADLVGSETSGLKWLREHRVLEKSRSRDR